MGTLVTIGVIVGALLVFLVILGLALSKFYHRATKQRSFVRTGKGGQKVVMDGGAIVLPILHEIIAINMQTLKLTVTRAKGDALITQDRLRVDVTAEFYVRVQPIAEAIANAAQTLGQSTLRPQELADLIEGKFVDALRAVAAKMDMNELHENRSDFVQEVQNTLNDDLAKNGLELESVSLTGLDQTDREHFNPNNAFDAQGLKKLAEVIEGAKKSVNDTERENQVAIAERDLAAKQRTLEIGRDQDYATMSTEREVANRLAEQKREIAEIEATQTKLGEVARIEAERETGEADIAKNLALQEKQILSDKALEEQRIGKEQTVEAADIARQKTIESAQIDKRKTVELADADKAIALANKSRDESEATAEAETARAGAVEAEQAAITVEATARAEREKRIVIINEEAEAGKDAAKILVAAAAEKTAAADRAEAVVVEAEAAKTADVVKAEGEAFRINAIAEAKAVEYATEAEGTAAINDAANQLPQAERDMQVKMALVTNMAGIVEAAAKPIGEIDSIRVTDLRGAGELVGSVNGGATTSVDADGNPVVVAGGGSNKSLPEQVVESAMAYNVTMPILEQLAGEIGIDLNSGMDGITNAIKDAGTTKTVLTETPKKANS